jgi:hypothetical protein
MMDGKEQYQVKISIRFAVLENLRRWTSIELGKLLDRSKFQPKRVGYYELKQR